MTNRQRTITLLVLAAAFITVCVMTCRSVLSKPRYDTRPEKAQCKIYQGKKEVIVDMAGTAEITEVRIDRPDGTRVDTHPGCGFSQCNYSLARFPSGTYHVTVISTAGTFAGDIHWHSLSDSAH